MHAHLKISTILQQQTKMTPESLQEISFIYTNLYFLVTTKTYCNFSVSDDCVATTKATCIIPLDSDINENLPPLKARV